MSVAGNFLAEIKKTKESPIANFIDTNETKEEKQKKNDDILEMNNSRNIEKKNKNNLTNEKVGFEKAGIEIRKKYMKLIKMKNLEMSDVADEFIPLYKTIDKIFEEYFNDKEKN